MQPVQILSLLTNASPAQLAQLVCPESGDLLQPCTCTPHVLQQYLPYQEQPPCAFTAAQDLIWPCVNLDISVADTSALQDVEPDPEPLLALPDALPLPRELVAPLPLPLP